ncbi:MAG: hypothetical protein ACKOXK_05040 [Chakrabartia sp.]
MTTAPVYAAVQNSQPSAPAPVASYGDLADFALASKIVAHVRIRAARPLTGALAVGVAAGQQRYLVTADVVALIKAPEGQPAQVKYLVDLPLDSRGKPVKLRKTESLVFARPARPGEWQLSATKAQLFWSPAAEQTVRTILTEAARADAPPMVRGINSAFHSAGSLPGEGETQIFLDSADNRPASLTIRRQPNQPPSWFVSLGEVVDEGVSQPAPDTLLWYRLACFLPAQMPAGAVDGQSADDARQVAEDYALVMGALGRCNRTGLMAAR